MNWGPAILLAVTVILGAFYHTHHFFDKRSDDLKEHLDKRFDDQRDFTRSEMKRIEDRLERSEHPLYRP